MEFSDSSARRLRTRRDCGPDHWRLYWLVWTGALLGNAAIESDRPDPGHCLDSARHGALAFSTPLSGGCHRSRRMVSSYDADRFRHLEHALLLHRRRPDFRSAARLSHLSGRYSSGDADDFHWIIYGAGRFLFDADRRGNRGGEIGPGLVCELGAGLGRIRKSLCGTDHYGGVFLHDYDAAVHAARPGAGLAEGDYQMVSAPPKDIAAEGASLRVSDVRKDFPTPGDPNVRTVALDGISLSVEAGELVSVIGPS